MDEWRHYLDDLMSSVGRINATYGDSAWEPVRVLVGESYQRAVAGGHHRLAKRQLQAIAELNL
jgi:trehalose-6-phosphate synthase